jgi:hypothetical protein
VGGNGGLVRHHDGVEEPVHRLVGGDALKSQPCSSWKPSSKGREHALDLSKAKDELRKTAFVTLGVFVSSLVIGACRGAWRGELDSIRDSLMIAGSLLLLGWMGTLLSVTLISIPEVICWSFRRIARSTSYKSKVGGVADEWLDGPT